MSIQNREGLLQGEEDKTCYFIDGEKPPQKKPSDVYLYFKNFEKYF